MTLCSDIRISWKNEILVLTAKCWGECTVVPPTSPFHSVPTAREFISANDRKKSKLYSKIRRNSNLLFKKSWSQKSKPPTLGTLTLLDTHMSKFANAGQGSTPSRAFLPKMFLGSIAPLCQEIGIF